MSFLDKLKTKVEEQPAAGLANPDEKKEKKTSEFLQLDVDIFQTSEAIVIVAPIPGVEVKDIDIAIENENDVVTIQGKREMPADVLAVAEKSFLRQECHWGPFYRQVILPQEVNVSEVSAKFKKGILVLTLPLLRLQSAGKKRIQVNTD